MLIGFVGDTHGRVFHALAVLAMWQRSAGRRFDLIIQVGDLGAFPDLGRVDEATRRYLAADPSEAEFSELVAATDARAAALRRLREQLGPIYFLRGNHEDFAWLGALPPEADGTVRVDPFDLFRYVPDGLATLGGVRIAFLGGAEEQGAAPAGIDRSAHAALLEGGQGAVDLLVSHQGPYGLGRGYYGDVQGSRLITSLLERLQPAYHVAGHRHVLDGPLAFGPTTYLGLSALVPSALWQPQARGLLPGCLAVLDTDAGALAPVTDSWLGEFPRPFDLDAWAARELR
jgi:Icc-related predicted phosphoesterase